MQIETDHRGHDRTGRPHWADPAFIVRAIMEALLRLLGLYDRMKRFNRNTRFKPTWVDSFDDLRRLEWTRARMRAIYAATLLSGKSFDDLPPFEMDEHVPEDFGGPCPRSPLEMNRRFLSLIRFQLDPHADVERYVRRLAKRERIGLSGCPLRHAAHATSPALRAEESTCACRTRRSLSSSGATRRGRWLAASSRRGGGGSRRLLAPASARAPPIPCRLPTTNHRPPRNLRFRERLRMPG